MTEQGEPQAALRRGAGLDNVAAISFCAAAALSFLGSSLPFVGVHKWGYPQVDYNGKSQSKIAWMSDTPI